ncbi:hypothetical protein, partial [Paenibacillus riograndensis]|uniref:hypothetical protein n=1 Tax=Paenibacillus riograndensis TaxID=483937 RepID=UPI001B7FBA06
IKIIRALPIFRLSLPVVIMKAVTASNWRLNAVQAFYPSAFVNAFSIYCLLFKFRGRCCIDRQSRHDINPGVNIKKSKKRL